MTQEERDLLATKIMKWEKPEIHRESWVTGSGNSLRYHMACRDWKPDQDLTQAWQLVEAIGRMSFSVRAMFLKNLKKQSPTTGKREKFEGTEPGVTIEPFYWFLFLADKPAAIAAAALAVAREIEVSE